MNEPTTPAAKPCSACGETKPLSEFYKNSGMPGGRVHQCKMCLAVRQVARRNANREEYLAAQHTYSLRTRDRKRVYDAEYREANRANLAVSKQRQHESARSAVFGHYGTFCACCGSTDRLNIDHISGGGTEHRQQVGRGYTFYLWLIRNDFPDGYQTLCSPCNASKFTGTRCRIEHGPGHRL